MPRTASKKTIKRKLDNLALQILRLLNDNCCEKCGAYVTGRQSQPHHIRSRKYNNTRWECYNLVHLCARCHRAYHDGEFGKDWFKEFFPECYKLLEEKQKEPTKVWKDWDFEQVEVGLRNKLDELKEET